MLALISLGVSVVALLFTLERYLNSTIKEEDSLAFRKAVAKRLLGRDVRMTIWASLDYLLEVASRVYGRPFSVRALVVSCVVAFFYNSLFFLLSWLIGGDPSIGGLGALPDGLSLLSRIVYFAVFALGFVFIVFSVIVLVYYHQRLFELVDGRSGAEQPPARLSVLAWLSLIPALPLAFTPLIYPLAIMSLPASYSLEALAISFAIFLGVLLSVRENGMTVATLPLAGGLAGVGAGWVGNVGCLHGLVIGAGAATTTMLLTEMGRGGKARYFFTLCGAAVLGFGVIVFWKADPGRLLGLLLSGDNQESTEEVVASIFWAIDRMLSIGESGPEGSFVVLLFFLIFPLVNGVWDWVSLACSRILVRHLVNSIGIRQSVLSTARRVALHASADFVIAALILGLMVLSASILISGADAVASSVGAGSAVSVGVILDDLHASPVSAKSFWLMLMMMSTLIPTSLHLIFAGGSALMVRYARAEDLRAMVRALKRDRLEDSSARRISFYLCVRWPLSALFSLAVFCGVLQVANFGLLEEVPAYLEAIAMAGQEWAKQLDVMNWFE